MRADWLLLAALAAGIAFAADEDPPAELLEFLGTFETSAGTPIDPTQLETPPPEDAEKSERGPEQ